MLKITIECEPPSTNNLYKRVRRAGKMPLSDEYNKFLAFARIARVDGVLPPANSELRCKIFVVADWYNKDGSVKNKDLDNFLKAPIDAFMKRILGSDKYIFELGAKKVQSPDGKFKVVIEIEPLYWKG